MKFVLLLCACFCVLGVFAQQNNSDTLDIDDFLPLTTRIPDDLSMPSPPTIWDIPIIEQVYYQFDYRKRIYHDTIKTYHPWAVVLLLLMIVWFCYPIFRKE